MTKCTSADSIYGDICFSPGKKSLPGVRGYVYGIAKRDIMTWPTIGAEAPKTLAGEPVVSRPAASSAAGAVKSPLPGVILSVDCKVGDTVKRGQKILVLEAMKMENEIVAPQDGTVASINVNKGDTVEAGQTIVTLA